MYDQHYACIWVGSCLEGSQLRLWSLGEPAPELLASGRMCSSRAGGRHAACPTATSARALLHNHYREWTMLSNGSWLGDFMSHNSFQESTTTLLGLCFCPRVGNYWYLPTVAQPQPEGIARLLGNHLGHVTPHDTFQEAVWVVASAFTLQQR